MLCEEFFFSTLPLPSLFFAFLYFMPSRNTYLSGYICRRPSLIFLFSVADVSICSPYIRSSDSSLFFVSGKCICIYFSQSYINDLYFESHYDSYRPSLTLTVHLSNTHFISHNPSTYSNESRHWHKLINVCIQGSNWTFDTQRVQTFCIYYSGVVSAFDWNECWGRFRSTPSVLALAGLFRSCFVTFSMKRRHKHV